MDNVESSNVLLSVDNGSSSAHVASASNHDEVSDLESNEVVDLVGRLNGRRVGCASGGWCDGCGGEKKLDGVVDLDGRVGVADGSAIVGDQVGDASGTELHALDLAELVFALLLGDAVNSESALDVVEQTEVLARLLERDDILETAWVGVVGADLAVDLDKTLGDNEGNLTAGQSVLELVAEEDREGKRFSEFVRTGRGSGSVGPAELVQHP